MVDDARLDEPFEHWCEVCGKTEVLTSEQAYKAGWDFPPRMGQWGVVSPRTCGSCPMDRTVWWAVAMDGYDARQLSAEQARVVARIQSEPTGHQAAPVSSDGVERRSELHFADGGSWVLSTRSGSQYLLQLDSDERTVIRLTTDQDHVHPDGTHPLRRDGAALPLLGFVDPPIQVGSPAYLVIGGLNDDPGYVSTTRATTPVVEIRRMD